MKVVILAGGLGTRLSEVTDVRPKPMTDIGERPILWHIMKTYSHFGHSEFVICLGYRGSVIKEYFSNYFLHLSDVTFDMSTREMEVHHSDAESWRVTLVDTGADTQTGGRVKRIEPYVGGETFFLTYGDGVADIDLHALLAFHRGHEAEATVTAVQPKGRFGAMQLGESGDTVVKFHEKPEGDHQWVNGGFFVLEPSVFDAIEGDDTVFEREPLESVAERGKLVAYRHRGFWQPMDTLSDKRVLERLWSSGEAPWKVW